MPSALLRTKLFVPPVRSELVTRRRLIGRLDEGLVQGRRLTLVSAPAGFGKTVLLSEWVAARRQTDGPLQVAWLSLDNGDADGVICFKTICRTISSMRSRFGPAVFPVATVMDLVPAAFGRP